MKRISFLIIACFATFCLQAQPKAFPTAEGFGAMATGGRGGAVVEVTTLEDNAENPPVGSLRWALNQHGDNPKTIVFRVSGIIELKGTGSRKGELRKTCKNVTIAGQTAPGEGICIMGDKVNFGGSENLIIRHLRFRCGTMNGDPAGKGSIGIENAKNWIIDHCTFGWSGEENMTIYDNEYTTIQYCILHEGLHVSGHNKGNRGYGCQWGGENVTFHHNLLAHNNSRSPRFNGARSNDDNVLIDYVNNVNYNWAGANSCYGSDIENSSNRTNFVNNYYKPGPARQGNQSSNFTEASYASSQGNKYAVFYMAGNYMEGSANSSRNANNYSGLSVTRYPANMRNIESFKSATPFEIPEQYLVKAETAHDAFESVLAGAGAFPRDTVDRRIIHETRTGTASGKGTKEKYLRNNVEQINTFYNQQKGIIDDPEAVGGYPEYKTYNEITDSDKDGMDDAWEFANGYNPADASDRNIVLPSGYTVLERYLNSLVNEDTEASSTSVNNIPVAVKNATGVKYYDIMGRQVSDASKSLTIRVTTFDNGSSEAEKVFLKR